MIFLLKIDEQPDNFLPEFLFRYNCAQQTSFRIGHHAVKLLYRRLIIMYEYFSVLKKKFWSNFFDGYRRRRQIHYLLCFARNIPITGKIKISAKLETLIK